LACAPSSLSLAKHFPPFSKVLEIVFFDKPEEFNPVLLIRFENVSGISVDNYDLDDNSIEIIIGLDLFQGGYCLHTDQREFTFKAELVKSCAIAVFITRRSDSSSTFGVY